SSLVTCGLTRDPRLAPKCLFCAGIPDRHPTRSVTPVGAEQTAVQEALMFRTRWLRVVAALMSMALLPAAGMAQQASGIAGEVRDASGAILPGVTVEATSSVLIEKVRTAVTDGEGLHKIIDLRPGTYAVTFSLTGFSTAKREGIELRAGFTAPVNAE